MNETDNKWRRLAAWARQAPADRPAGAPFGFAARVAARWREADGGASSWQAWGILSRRALALSCAVMVVSLGLSYGALRESWRGDQTFTESVAELADGEISWLLLP